MNNLEVEKFKQKLILENIETEIVEFNYSDNISKAQSIIWSKGERWSDEIPVFESYLNLCKDVERFKQYIIVLSQFDFKMFDTWLDNSSYKTFKERITKARLVLRGLRPYLYAETIAWTLEYKIERIEETKLKRYFSNWFFD